MCNREKEFRSNEMAPVPVAIFFGGDDQQFFVDLIGTSAQGWTTLRKRKNAWRANNFSKIESRLRGLFHADVNWLTENARVFRCLRSRSEFGLRKCRKWVEEWLRQAPTSERGETIVEGTHIVFAYTYYARNISSKTTSDILENSTRV